MRRNDKLLRAACDRLVDWLAPRRCAFCAATGGPVCERCERLLPYNERACPRCANALPVAPAEGIDCGACLSAPPSFARAAAPLLYQFPVDSAIKSMKFRRQLFYVPAFVSLVVPLIGRHFAHCDALLPVPLHRVRHAWRGFNQATELARGISRHCELPVLHCARRIRATKTQSGLSAAERRSNLSRAFAIKGVPGCRHPLIIDDVITTGSTCDELARALLKKGAETVSVLAVARAQPGGGRVPGARPRYSGRVTTGSKV